MTARQGFAYTTLRYDLGAAQGETRMRTCHKSVNLCLPLTAREASVGKIYQFAPHGSDPRLVQPLDGIGDLFDGACAGVFDGATGDSSQRVVVNPGLGCNGLPCPIPLTRLQRRNDLIESHGDILGVGALRVKASAPSPYGHSQDVKKEAPKTAFQDNLRRMIGEQSVNSWSKARGLEQTTIQRLYDGSDPKLSMIERIAKAVHAEPWQLLAPGFQVNNPPIMLARVQDLREVVPPAPPEPAPAPKVSRPPVKAARVRHAR